MRKLALAGIKDCTHCDRAIAYLMTEGGEHTLAIALDAVRAKDLSREPPGEGQEASLIGLLIQLLSSSSYLPQRILLEFNDREQSLFARVDLTTAAFLCSSQEAVAFAAATDVRLCANEEIFARQIAFQNSPHKEKCRGANRAKPKTTIH